MGSLLLWTLAVPAALVAAALTLTSTGPVLFRGRRWPLVLALAASAVLAQVAATGLPSVPPREALHWLPFAALAAAVLGGVDGVRPWPTWPRLAVHTAVFAGTCLALSGPFRERWGPGGSLGFVGAATVGALGLMLALERLGERAPRALTAAAAATLAAGTGAVHLLSGSARMAQLSGGIASGLGCAAAAALLGARFEVQRGPAAVVACWFAGLLTAGHLYANVPLGCTVLLVAASLAGAATAGRGRPWRVAVATVVPVVAAVVLAWALGRGEDPYSL